MAEPTSWLTIEPGWEVVDATGTAVGDVREVVGDADADIFNGLRVDAGDTELYVPADSVEEIVDGRVTLDTEASELPETPAEGEPGGAEIERDRDAEL
jgi:Uncharacterized protein conserved in bacteria (DUF2171)